MVAFYPLHKRNAYFFLMLFLTFATFTTNILDLRDEFQLLPCFDEVMTDDITTAIQSDSSFHQPLTQEFCTLNQNSLVSNSSFHAFPVEDRSPPHLSFEYLFSHNFYNPNKYSHDQC